jgi:hypothetical protein
MLKIVASLGGYILGPTTLCIGYFCRLQIKKQKTNFQWICYPKIDNHAI